VGGGPQGHTGGSATLGTDYRHAMDVLSANSAAAAEDVKPARPAMEAAAEDVKPKPAIKSRRKPAPDLFTYTTLAMPKFNEMLEEVGCGHSYRLSRPLLTYSYTLLPYCVFICTPASPPCPPLPPHFPSLPVFVLPASYRVTFSPCYYVSFGVRLATCVLCVFSQITIGMFLPRSFMLAVLLQLTHHTYPPLDAGRLHRGPGMR